MTLTGTTLTTGSISAPTVNVDAELKRLRRELARGNDTARLLSELVALSGAAFAVRSVGIQRESTKEWSLAPNASPSVARHLERSTVSAQPHEWVVSVPLFDDGVILGRFVLVAPTVNRTSAQRLADANVDAIIETAALLLMSNQSGGTAAPSAATPAVRTDSKLVEELRRDLQAGRFAPHYQPVIELATEHVVAFEALARWNHPEKGWVRAADFIEQAEQCDLIADIQSIVFRLAAERARGWLDSGMKRVRINLKLSSAQLRSPRLIDYLTRLMATYQLPDATLGLLLTEKMLADPVAAGAVNALGASGFRVTLEGMAPSLAGSRNIRDLPLYAVKIDRAIVSRLGIDTSATQAARSLIQVARTLGVKAIAEGVENRAQRDHLAELRCDAALGFHWSPAVESEVANSMMRFQPFASRLAQRNKPSPVRK